MKILRNNTYSDKEPTVRIGHWRNKKKFSELTDKQLKNIANYENEKHPGYIRSIIPSIATGALMGATIGTSKGKVKKGALVGAGLGALFEAGTTFLAHKHHMKQVRHAKEELSKRNNDK